MRASGGGYRPIKALCGSITDGAIRTDSPRTLPLTIYTDVKREDDTRVFDPNANYCLTNGQVASIVSIDKTELEDTEDNSTHSTTPNTLP